MMTKFDLEEAVQIAGREGRPIRILDEFITADSISVKMVSSQMAQDARQCVKELASQNWEQICTADLFNGKICAVQSIYTSGESVSIEVVETDYKTFRATDRIIEGVEGYFPPLAVGVHALLLGSQSILALKLADGTFGTAGGAVDVSDFARDGSPFANALQREINEETGIEVDKNILKLCGIYIVNNPIHLVFIYVAILEEDVILKCDLNRTVELEKISGLQLIDRDDISSIPNSIYDALGLCISSAKRRRYL